MIHTPGDDLDMFENWKNRRFDDLAVEFVEANEDKFEDWAYGKFIEFLQNQDEEDPREDLK